MSLLFFLYFFCGVQVSNINVNSFLFDMECFVINSFRQFLFYDVIILSSFDIYFLIIIGEKD